MRELGLILMLASTGLLVLIFQYWFQTGIFHKKRRKAGQVNFFRNLLSLIEGEKKTTKKGSRNSDITSYEKGLSFEKYVTGLFPKSAGYELLEWRGDKFHRGVYAASVKYPDLEYRHISPSSEQEFAIECKWRKGFWNGEIQIVEEGQLVNYNEFSKRKRIPVYIILGVGGHPMRPSELFLIPLAAISAGKIPRAKILDFKKASTSIAIVFEKSFLST